MNFSTTVKTLDSIGPPSARASALSLMPPEIVAVDIAAAADALGAIAGEVTGEDVLDAVFRDFCMANDAPQPRPPEMNILYYNS